ncbi:MAG: class I SAM-dependent methyltransferase [Bacteroidales bacterium]|nr:class I SAM-dependent methyltransferase [Bacteroidales bacterium]
MNCVTQKIIKDIFQWDVDNWSKVLDHWKKYLPNDVSNFKVLEIGARNGGLSLLFSILGVKEILCTDVSIDYLIEAKKLHSSYNLKNIFYEELDALNINYQNYFDIITFKSVVGGVSSNNRQELKTLFFANIHKALKEGGWLFFCENLEASAIHKFFRKNFTKWGKNWNYIKYTEINKLIKEFSFCDISTYGFFGCFGRSEKQRNYLAKLDNLITCFIPRKFRYILSCVARK